MQTVSFRIDEDKKSRIDALAAIQDRDRSYVINAALDAYIELMDWQLGHIREGLRQADADEFADGEELSATLNLWKQ